MSIVITSGPGVMSVSGPRGGHRDHIEFGGMAARRHDLADLDKRGEIVERLRDAVVQWRPRERRGPDAASLHNEKDLRRHRVGLHEPFQLPGMRYRRWVRDAPARVHGVHTAHLAGNAKQNRDGAECSRRRPTTAKRGLKALSGDGDGGRP